jgi:hypothetical protein
LPQVPFYFLAVGVLTLSGVLFLFNLNFVLQRLAAMLPDETLRLETKFFTSFNLYLLLTTIALVGLYVILQQIDGLPLRLVSLIQAIDNNGPGRQWLLIFLILLPLAMTMTLIWKIKEVVLASVFEAGA